ncbi:MAG: type II toxin-antitoxin system RelE/ParE family toxin [Polyangiaceae bacterium]
MSRPVVFHPLAEEELNEAAAYYAEARPGLGEAFLNEAQRALDALSHSPLAGTTVDRDVRWWLLSRFPYSILYRALPDHIRVLAVAHQKRRPLYWHARR